MYIPEDYEVHEWGNAKEQAEFLKEMEDTERYKNPVVPYSKYVDVLRYCGNF